MADQIIFSYEQGPRGLPGNFDALQPAADTVPDEYIVRQGGVWVRATHAQMVTWLGDGDSTVPLGAVLLNGSPVTVGGLYITVT